MTYHPHILKFLEINISLYPIVSVFLSTFNNQI